MADLTDFMQAANTGAQWLLEHQGEHGSFEADVLSAYKVPYALDLVGHPGEATRTLDWIAGVGFTANGVLDQKDKSGVHPFSLMMDIYPSYWVAMGAHRLGRFDASYRLHRIIREKYWDPATGGIFFNLHGGTNGNEVDTLNCSFGGLVSLYLGDLETARASARCLRRILESQDEPDKFWAAMTQDGKLDKDPGEGDILWRRIDKTSENQCYFLGGHAVGFLSMLYMATGEGCWLDVARGYRDMLETCAADRRGHTSAGKYGFGAAQLYRATRDPQARQAAMDVGRFLLSIQSSDGYWVFPGTQYVGPDAIAVDLTAEFVAWLAEIAVAMSYPLPPP